MKQSIGSGRGSVYNIIMKALQSGDKYGYEICQEVEEKTNGNYILKQPSLYSGLKRLEAQKLVESYWGDSDIGGRRHYYRLTESGRKKIESTDFSWEDERNDIVESFFQKSEIEKKIDEIKDNVESIKQDSEKQEQINQEAIQVLDNSTSTNNETNNTKPKTSLFGHKVNENQFDLFSFANANDNIDEKYDNSENLDDKNIADDVENDKPVENSVQMTEEVKEDDEKITAKEENQKEIVDFSSYFNNNNSSFNDTEDKTEYQSDNNTEQNIENASFPAQTNSDELEKEANEQLADEQVRLEQEKRMSNILSGDLNEIPELFSKQTEEKQQEHSISFEVSEETKKQIDDFNDINFKSIFGDLVVDDKKEEDLTVIDNNQEHENVEPFTDELPRYDIGDNINLSLRPTDAVKNIEKTDDLDEKQYSQERIDNHFSPNIERSFNFDVQTTDLAQKNQFQESISFDKKYQNKDFGEYCIRPLRKNNIENKVSNFTLINKLNFFNSLTLNVLFLVAVSLIYSFNRDMFNSNIVQLAILIGCTVIFQCCFVYQLLRYLGNKDKKTIFKFEKEKFFNSLFIGIIAMLVVVSVNILFGLKLTNITEYLGSLVIPIILFCGLILSPITKIILNKFNIFNK